MVSPKSIRSRQRYAEDPEYRERKLASIRKYQAAHRDELNERRRERLRTDPEYRERHRHYHYRRYGLTPEDRHALWARQGGACAICRKKLPLGIDHCHWSKLVRGLLCSKCNVGLGQFDDDTDRMLAAIAYLEASRRDLDDSADRAAIAAKIVERLQRRLKPAVRAAFALRGRRRRGWRQGGGERGSQGQVKPGRGANVFPPRLRYAIRPGDDAESDSRRVGEGRSEVQASGIAG